MSPLLLKPSPPSTDKRWKLVDATMRRHGNATNALIESLHTAQEVFGYLDKASLQYIAASLRVPLSKAYGVATFYHLFQMKPPGVHTCVVCTGTACYIKGAGELLESMEQAYGVKAGETTPDGQLSVLTARCLGSCGLAPAIVFDDAVAGKISPQDTLKRLAHWTAPAQ
jgi:bidirectional [NiFe] hydrogenase diaphorase subunit